MSIPPRLSVKLNDVLGIDAAQDLVNWMDEMRADHAELRHEMHLMRNEMGAMRTEVSALRVEIGALAHSMSEKFDRLVGSVHAVDQRVSYLRGQFIAWSAAFWLTAVTVIVGLIQLLRP